MANSSKDNDGKRSARNTRWPKNVKRLWESSISPRTSQAPLEETSPIPGSRMDTPGDTESTACLEYREIPPTEEGEGVNRGQVLIRETAARQTNRPR